MKKRLVPIILGLIFISILAFQFVLNYNFRSDPPSPQWSKEIAVSSGKINGYPKLLKIDNNYIIAHDDGNKVVIIKTDNLGKKIAEKTYPAGSELVNNLNLLYDGKDVYVNWTGNEDNTNVLHNIVMDKSLKEINKWDNKGVNEAVQIGENVMISSGENGIEFTDLKEKQTINIKTPDASYASLLSGTDINGRYLATYYSKKDGKLKYLYFSDGKASDIKALGLVVLSSDQSFTGAAIASDGTQVYEVLEIRSRGQFGQGMFVQFSMDGDNFKMGKLTLPGITTIYNPISASSSSKGARFLASCERLYGKKDIQKDIVDFTIKNGAAANYSFVSRTGAFTSMPAFYDNTVLFSDFISLNESRLYMSSQDKAFMDAANRTRPSEIATALGDTFQGLIMSIADTFTIGIFILIPSVIIIGALSIVGYGLKKERKKQMFIAIYILMAAVKVIVFYNAFYKLHGDLLPQILSSGIAVILLNIIISITPFIMAYRKYSENLEAMAIAPFMLSIGIDIILSQMLFVPFIS